MNKNTCLTYKDLSKMDQLLGRPTSIESKHNLTELDRLAIKVIDDIHQYPIRFFYNLRRLDNKNEDKHSENAKNHFSKFLKR